MFEKATRMKLRIPFKGQISVEDLWDLSVTELDGIYKKLYAQQQNEAQVSLLKPLQTDTALNLQVGLVQFICEKKLAEHEDRKQRAKNQERKRRIAEILVQREDESLKNLSEEELRKLLMEGA